MFLGRYDYAIDEKGRLSFPAKFRDEIGESFVVSRWVEDCLAAFPEQEWNRVAERLYEKGELVMSRDAQLNLFTSATQVQVDRQGRILLPLDLREKAGIDREVTIVGVGRHAEIWCTDAWNHRSERLTSGTLMKTMEKLEL